MDSGQRRLWRIPSAWRTDDTLCPSPSRHFRHTQPCLVWPAVKVILDNPSTHIWLLITQDMTMIKCCFSSSIFVYWLYRWHRWRQVSLRTGLLPAARSVVPAALRPQQRSAGRTDRWPAQAARIPVWNHLVGSRASTLLECGHQRLQECTRVPGCHQRRPFAGCVVSTRRTQPVPQHHRCPNSQPESLPWLTSAVYPTWFATDASLQWHFGGLCGQPVESKKLKLINQCIESTLI